MLIDDDRLHIAIQKNGRLSDVSRDLLKGAGLRLQNGRNALTARVENFAADVMFVRDDDIPTFVADGVCEFGIVGGNVLEEFRLSSSEPAVEIVAELYRRRWTIELFFRFFKHVLGCRHLLSTAKVGVEIQTYCAIIVCLLLALWTGGRPTLRTYEMICLYLQGWADQEELQAHLEKLKPQVA